jgi:hypothetical protein
MVPIRTLPVWLASYLHRKGYNEQLDLEVITDAFHSRTYENHKSNAIINCSLKSTTH